MNKLVEKAIRDRRPLRIREIGPWKPIAHHLAGSWITPNTISAFGLLAGAASGLLLAATGCPLYASQAWWLGLLAVLAIVLRGCCNILDGVLAVETEAASPVGTLWNEVPDRLSDAATLIGAGYALGGSSIMGWAAALAAVLTAYIRAQTCLAGAPMDFRGPMAKPARMAVLAIAVLWTSLAPASLRPAFGPEGQYGVVAVSLAVIVAGCLVTMLRRLRAAAAALREAS